MPRLHAETLRLLGGQRQEGAPPGIAVFTPPLHPAKSREEEIFVMFLELEGEAPSRLYRDIREVSAQAFWSTAAAVTAALRQAVMAANRVLFQHNLQTTDQQRCYGAISCVAVKENELFLVQAGPAHTSTLSEGVMEQFPRQALPPLGASEYAEVRVVYRAIEQGDIMLLASQGLIRSATADGLERVLSLPEKEAIWNGLEQLAAGRDFTVLLMYWGVEELPAPAATRPERRRPVAPQPAQVPVEDAPVEAPRTQAPREDLAVKKPPAEAPREVLPSEMLPRRVARDAPRMETPPPPVEEPTARVWAPVEPAEPEAEIPLWEPTAEPSPSRPRPTMRARLSRLNLGRRARRVQLWLGATIAQTGSNLRALFRRTLPGKERRRRRPKTERRPPPAENPRVMIAIAIAIVGFVALVTFWTWFNFGSTVRRQQVLHQAQVEASLARQSTSSEEQHSHWETVLTILAEMEDDPERDLLIAEAQDALDSLDGVIRVAPLQLWSSNADISARRLVARGSNLFLLDVVSQSVIQLTLSETGAQVLNQTPAILTTGQEREGLQVAALVDMAWNAPGGEWTLDRLIILDAASYLWVYDPAWPETTYPLPLGPAQGEGASVVLTTFEGRLYVLDRDTNQIWRYWSRDGGYPDRAEPYFATGTSQSFAFAHDLTIDGNIYVLLDDGGIIKYFDGERVSFTVSGVPAPEPHFVAMTVDLELTNGPLFLADAADERLVILDATGNFVAQLRADPGTLGGLQAVALDELGEQLFFLAGGQLYTVALPSLP